MDLCYYPVIATTNRQQATGRRHLKHTGKESYGDASCESAMDLRGGGVLLRSSRIGSVIGKFIGLLTRASSRHSGSSSAIGGDRGSSRCNGGSPGSV
mmetsp:Transcript_21234/g.44605  ORF Transcript_21234/g.44605 Transcript_21234/m.44605 type:complete len:97 (+) Transcript_21234:61-351(+)